MPRVLSIFFLLLILFAYTDVTEWFRMHHLFEHYTLHQEHNPEMTFTEFLAMHYAEGNGHCGESSDHHLPFQNVDSQHHSFPFPESDSHVSFSGQEINFFKPSALYTESDYLEPGIEFWQPPKLS
jgi:hypothetical protein